MLSLGGRLPGNIKLLKTYSPLEYTLAIEAPQIASYLETFLKNFVLDVQPPRLLRIWRHFSGAAHSTCTTGEYKKYQCAGRIIATT